MFKFIQLSSLEKVFLDHNNFKNEFNEMSVLKSERFFYQIAYTYIDEGETTSRRISDFAIKITSPLKNYISIRTVENVPAQLTHYPNSCDNDYLRKKPGLYPDLLMPLKQNIISVCQNIWHSLWITVDAPESVSAGKYPIEITFYNEEYSESKIFFLEIIDAVLPEQKLIFTQWFHTDCLASIYNTKIFSKKHWELIDKFIQTAAKNGINTILTPIFTPPLDTKVGGERPTVQLVEITKTNNEYSFDFSKLKKWISILKKNGIKYIEISHLFTQWGAKAAPKILANVNGVKKRIFGWDTPAASKDYKNFLDIFLPQLVSFLKAEKIDKQCFFHISDEPNGSENIQTYSMAKNITAKHLKGFKIIDALSSFEYYKDGIVTNPIPASDHIELFLENNVKDLWTYYCCAQGKDVCNRFLDMPSYRNRAIGMQLYKFDIKGFLHWGYNFYYSQLSKEVINPFLVTDGKNAFPAGDAFSVYPGKNGPLESLRLNVFFEALQDIRSMELLEKYIGRQNVVSLIEKCTNIEISFKNYPKSSELIIEMRKKINQKIKENLA